MFGRRRVGSRITLLAVLVLGSGLVIQVQAGPPRENALRVATGGEPLTLDTVATTDHLAATITLPIFEELFTFDASWQIQPLLAESYTRSEDERTYAIKLRKHVPFHNGREMTAQDVVASLNRWGTMSPRGTSVYKNVESVSASDHDTVIIRLKEPFGPLLSFLALPGGAAVIMPREIVEATGPSTLKEYVGTGPYRFVEWIPDRHVKLARFEQYAMRSEVPSGYAGKREALADAIWFYPVSQEATRIAGARAGDYDVVEGINRDVYSELRNDPRVVVEIIKPGSFLTFFFNKKQGLMTNEKLRQAVLIALDMKPIMQVAFSNPELYALNPSIYPKGTPWYTTAGADLYNIHDVTRARQLMQEAGYAGEPIRWLTTQQTDHFFKSTVVAVSQLEHAGFKVDLQVLEWASLLDRRAKPADYELFTTSLTFVPDPSLNVIFYSFYPGWWDSPEKNKLFDDFTRISDQRTRARIWAELQALVYRQAPLVRPGEFFGLVLRSRTLQGFHPSDWTILWNVRAVGGR